MVYLHPRLLSMHFASFFALCYGLLFARAIPQPSAAAFDPSQLFNLNLVTHINVFVTLDSLVNNLVS